MSIESLMPSNQLILCCSLLLLPPIFPNIRVFSNESVLHIRWPKYWHFRSSTLVLPMDTHDWSPLGWTGWNSLQSKGLSRVFSNTTVQKYQFFGAQLSSQSNSHIHTWPLEKPQTFVGKIMSLLFNMLSRLVITFLPRSKNRFYFIAAVTICSAFGDLENKVCHCFHCFPIYLPCCDGNRCHNLTFLNVEL